MSFVISNLIYSYQGHFDDRLSTKSNKITGLIDFALITSTVLIGGLIIGNVLNFGLPMGVGTTGNYVAWGCVGFAGGVAVTDIIAAVLIKRNIDASLPRGKMVIKKDGDHEFLIEIPSNTPVSISMKETQNWLEEWKRKNR